MNQQSITNMTLDRSEESPVLEAEDELDDQISQLLFAEQTHKAQILFLEFLLGLLALPHLRLAFKNSLLNAFGE